MRLFALVFGLVILGLGTASTGWSKPKAKARGAAKPAGAAGSKKEAIKALIKEGMRHMDVQEYDQAAKSYEDALKLEMRPMLIFYSGQAWRLAGEHEKALAAFRHYLRRAPKAANRGEVERAIADVTAAMNGTELAAVKNESGRPAGVKGSIPTASPPPAIDEPPPRPMPELAGQPEPTANVPAVDQPSAPRPGRSFTIAGAVLTGLGIAALGAGAGLVAVAHVEADKYRDRNVFDKAKQDKINTYQYSGFAMLAVGGAAAITGVALLVVGRSRAKRESRAMWLPTIGVGSVGATAFFSF